MSTLLITLDIMLARKMKKTTPKQFEVLVNYLQSHYDLEVSFASSEAKSKRQEMWIQLTDKLNSYGPPVRTCVEWKSIWSDYKYNLKRKISADLKLAKRRDCNKRLSFNKTEQTVIHLLGLNNKHLSLKKSRRKEDVPLVEILPDPLNANSSPQYDPAESDVEIDDDKEAIVISNDFDSTTTTPAIDSIEPLASEEQYMETADCDINVSAMLNDTLMAMQTTQLAVLKELKESNRHKRNTHVVKARLLELEHEKLNERKLQNYEENKQSYIRIELERKRLEMYEMKLKGHCTQCTMKNETD